MAVEQVQHQRALDQGEPTWISQHKIAAGWTDTACHPCQGGDVADLRADLHFVSLNHVAEVVSERGS